tara:strand:- start:80772 stop:80882 length:111 start_codon:yes stop_codon:yes gene_type:complete
MNQFNKSVVSITEQIGILQHRGLAIQNPERAERYLE